MMTFGLNLFGGGGTGPGETHYIGPWLTLDTETVGLPLETDTVALDMIMVTQDVVMDVESVTITITRNPDGFIIGTC